MQALKKQIKEKQIRGIYLFYGQEKYVLQTYLMKMVNIALGDGDKTMNYDVFDSPSVDADRVSSALQTLPFFSELRVVVLRELELFKGKNVVKLEQLIPVLQALPESTVCFIIENEIDKRSKNYKALQTIGQAVEFKTQSEDELCKYIIDQLTRSGKRADQNLAKAFLHVVGYDLTIIHNELKKLNDFCSAEEIAPKDIQEICTRSIENRIFELVDCMGTRQRAHALRLFTDLLVLKEPAPRILYMITRQFRLILQTKLLVEKHQDRQAISSKLKIAPFIVDKNIKQARCFTVEKLKQALKNCYDAEVDLKTGRMDLELGIELLIVKYSTN